MFQCETKTQQAEYKVNLLLCTPQQYEAAITIPLDHINDIIVAMCHAAITVNKRAKPHCGCDIRGRENVLFRKLCSKYFSTQIITFKSTQIIYHLKLSYFPSLTVCNQVIYC